MRTTRSGDAIRVRASINQGQVIAFTVQFEVYFAGRFRPAERYDSAHGAAHRDPISWFGETVAKTWLPESMSLNDAFRSAENDFLANADRYRREFLNRGNPR